MSPSSWQENTERILRDLSKSKPAFRLAFLGVGSRQHGDDGAGPEVIAQLKKAGLPQETVLLVDGGPAPENFTGALRRFQPDLVLLIDAAWMGLEPGSLALIGEEQIGGAGASTHGMSLALLAGYLREELGCAVFLLAVQPEQTDWDRPIGLKIRRAVRKAARELAEIYSRNISTCSPSVSS